MKNYETWNKKKKKKDLNMHFDIQIALGTHDTLNIWSSKLWIGERRGLHTCEKKESTHSFWAMAKTCCTSLHNVKPQLFKFLQQLKRALIIERERGELKDTTYMSPPLLFEKSLSLSLKGRERERESNQNNKHKFSCIYIRG